MFDRFDICEAYFVWACDWGEYEVIARLNRLGFKPRPRLSDGDAYAALEEGAQDIYDALNARSEADPDWYAWRSDMHSRKRIVTI